jgi:F-type H+-transporting ATPase subunit a
MGAEEHSEEIGSVIIHHVADSEPLIPLHLFGMDLSITKHVIMLWVAGAVVVALFLLGTRRYRRQEMPIPTGFSNLLEMVVDVVHTQIVRPNIGLEYARFWSPLILGYFTMILTANLLGLVPFFDRIPGGGGHTATGDPNVTGALAIVTFFAVIVAGIIKHGPISYWRTLAPPGTAWPVLFILVPIEILGMFVRPFALTMRLAANMTAGHIAMLAILAPVFLMGNPFVGIGSVALNIGISFLEIIVSLVQAYVFTLLSSVFIGMAINPEH